MTGAIIVLTNHQCVKDLLRFVTQADPVKSVTAFDWLQVCFTFRLILKNWKKGETNPKTSNSYLIFFLQNQNIFFISKLSYSLKSTICHFYIFLSISTYLGKQLIVLWRKEQYFYTQFNSIINGKQNVCVIRPDRHYGTLQVNCWKIHWSNADLSN